MDQTFILNNSSVNLICENYLDENSMAIKHTKIQEEGGRWCIEFIPLSMGVHLIHRILMIDEKPKSHLLHKINVFNYSSHRIVYGYKLYNIQDPVQLVFDSANFDVNNIVPEIKGIYNSYILVINAKLI